MRYKSLLIIVIVTNTIFAQIKQGIWRGVLMLNEKENRELPFNFEIKTVNKKIQLIIHNAEERIVVDEVTVKKDSFNFKMPVFDSEFRCKLIEGKLLKGVWINHAKKDASTSSATSTKILFTATYGISDRFLSQPEKPYSAYEGKWEVSFSPNTADSSKAIGVFKHLNGSSYVSGTFLTETGDYRFLDGKMIKNKLYLSCFDGAHAFLFTAETNNGLEISNGHFYSGATWDEPWIAKKNENFKLRNAESITQLKSPTEKIEFSFFNLEKQKVSLSDDKFKNKPVVIQIMGSWCPNCMDETAYLATVYEQYKNQGLKIIALAYERTSDFEKAKNNVTRLKTKFNANYTFLITGLTGKDKATESLSFLNKVSAFPTTIVLDKNHQVKTIYTGFSGPATGKEYGEFKVQFDLVIKELLK